MTVGEVEVAPGYRTSRLIKGGWPPAGRGPDSIAGLLAFARAGVTTFETSDTYPGGEEQLGRLRMVARSRLPAECFERLRVHTRVSAPFAGRGPTAHDLTRRVDRALASLGVDRLDLLQLQWWNLEVPGLVEAALHLDTLRRRGKLARLGVCNLGVDPLRRLLEAGVPLATDQVHHSLVDRRAEGALASFCAERGIGLLTFAPWAGGFLSGRWQGLPDPLQAGGETFSEEFRALIEIGGGWLRLQRQVQALHRVGERHGRSIAAVALRWMLQRGPGAAIIFGAAGPRRLPDILGAFEFVLSDEDLYAIEEAGLDTAPVDVGVLERAPGSPLMRAIHAHSMAPA